MNHKSLFYIVLSTIFSFSCVYFNTFYNAENSFKKALKIIEESPIIIDEKLPSQASKLLGEAIENSKLVLEKHSTSKYVDDAIFIIGRASFLRNEVAVAEKHFKKMLSWYPESKYEWVRKDYKKGSSAAKGKKQTVGTELLIIKK